MTGLTIRPLPAADLPAFVRGAEGRYAQEKTRLGGIPADVARDQAHAETEALFGDDGRLEEGHAVLQAFEGSTTPIGYAWLGPHPREGTTASLYDILVDPVARGRGIGRALLTAAEDHARSAGCTELSLHVFGANRGAIALYESRGYRTTDVSMRRSL